MENNRLNYANLGDRVLAFLTDIIIKWALTLVILSCILLFSSERHINYNDVFISPLFNLILIVLIFIESVYSAVKGTTIGNKIFKLKILAKGGKNPGLFRYFFRNLFEIFISYPILIGVAPIIYNPQKKAWHDSLFGTYVISERPTPEQTKEVLVSVKLPFIIGFAALFSAVSYYLVTFPSAAAAYYYQYFSYGKIPVAFKFPYMLFEPIMLLHTSGKFNLYWAIISTAIFLLAVAALFINKKNVLKIVSTYLLFACIVYLVWYVSFDYAYQAGLLRSCLMLKLQNAYGFQSSEKNNNELFGEWDDFVKNFDARKDEPEFINKWKQMIDARYAVNSASGGEPEKLITFSHNKSTPFISRETRKQYLDKGERYLLFDGEKRLQAFAVLNNRDGNINVVYFEIAPWNLCSVEKSYKRVYFAITNELFKNIALLYKKDAAAKNLTVEILPCFHYELFFPGQAMNNKTLIFDRRSIIIFLYPER